MFEFEAEVLVEIELPGGMEEGLGEVGIDVPVAGLVGVGQGVARDGAAKAQVIEFVVLRTQAGFDIPQAFPVGELCEGQAEELVEAGEGFNFVMAAIALHTTPKGMHWQVGHDLREDKIAGVHGVKLPGSVWE